MSDNELNDLEEFLSFTSKSESLNLDDIELSQQDSQSKVDIASSLLTKSTK